MSSLAEMATIFLAPKYRDAVLGDLAETGASGWSALGSVLGLLVRQQMELWRAWQPWIASSMVFAGSLLLLGVSFGLSVDSRHLLRGDRGYGSVLCEALLMLSWAWTSGFVVGSLSLEDAMGERPSVRDSVPLLCASVSGHISLAPLRALVSATRCCRCRAGSTSRSFVLLDSADVGNSHDCADVGLGRHVHAELVLVPARMVACG